MDYSIIILWLNPCDTTGLKGFYLITMNRILITIKKTWAFVFR